MSRSTLAVRPVLAMIAMLLMSPEVVPAQTPATNAVVPVTDAMLQNPSPDD